MNPLIEMMNQFPKEERDPFFQRLLNQLETGLETHDLNPEESSLVQSHIEQVKEALR